MFKIQMNVIEYGLSGSSTINKIPTGVIIERTNTKTGKKELISVAVRFAPSYLKKNQYKTLKTARQIIDAHPLQKALYDWYTKTELLEEVKSSPGKTETSKSKRKGTSD